MTGLSSGAASPFVVARIPLLPLAVADEIYGTTDLHATVEAIFARYPMLSPALRIASPTLRDAIERSRGRAGPERDRIAEKLAAYVLRAASRTTPFGLFCGVTPVPAADGATLALAPSIERRTRPDGAWLHAFAKRMQPAYAERESAVLFANPLRSERGDRTYFLRADEYEYERRPQSGFTSQNVRYTKLSAKTTRLLRSVLQLTADGAQRRDVVRMLAEQHALDEPQAGTVVGELIACGILLTGLRLSPLSSPAERLNDELCRVGLPTELAEILCMMRAVDAITDPAELDAKLVELNAMMRSSVSEARHCFQVDYRPVVTGGLPRTVTRCVSQLVDLYKAFSADEGAAALRAAFHARYEGSTRLVPVLEAFDPDTGIGTVLGTAPAWPAWFEAELASLAMEAVRDGRREIELAASTLEKLSAAARASTWQPSTDIGFRIIAADRAAIDAGDFQVALGDIFAASTAGAASARLAELFSEPETRALAVIAEPPADDSLCAELTFVPPTARHDNVTSNFSACGYELQLGFRDDRLRKTLRIDDLYVGVHGNRLILWSMEHQKRVRLIQTHMLKSDAGPPLIHQLITAAADGERSLQAFHWGACGSLPYLPRVRSGRLILSWARWNLRFPPDAASRPDDYLRDRLSAWGTPHRVYLVDFDQRLLVDWTTPLGLALIRRELKRRPEMLAFEECPAANSTSWFTGARGEPYLIDFVEARRVESPRRTSAALARPSRRDATERHALHWLYFRLYAAPDDIDRLVRVGIAPLLVSLNAQGLLKRWHFLRYADPQPHVRLRIEPATNRKHDAHRQAMDAFERLLRDNAITRLVVDTYERENERYGGASLIDSAERLFEAQSAHFLRRARAEFSDADARLHASVSALIEVLDRVLPGPLAAAWKASGPRGGRLRPADRSFLRSQSPRAASDLPSHVLLAYDAYRNDVVAEHGDERYVDIADSIVHMHFNRWGVYGAMESRGRSLVAAWIQGLRARSEARL